MLERMQSNWNSLILLRIKNGSAILEEKFSSFYEVKHTYPWPTKSTPRYLPKGNKNLGPYKGPYSNVYSYLFIIAKLKTNQMSINW